MPDVYILTKFYKYDKTIKYILSNFLKILSDCFF